MDNKIRYCEKCGKELTEDSLQNFCDKECRNDYWSEIRKDKNFHLVNSVGKVKKGKR